MRLLLDTHALMWWAGKSKRLPRNVRDLLADTTQDVFMSVANAWEMQIKAQIGKLTLHKPWLGVVRDEMTMNGFHLLHVELSHIEVLDRLPLHHKDPFDRLLIAQAIHENLTLVTNDPKFPAYPVNVLW